ncbi:uncharacterized protein [Branchiostoma lanceolatum]|uniref:uncharacterized protein n=1 Tax=Branchiostoma lanceolatum TaxID=7740 RepID=UPI0034528673
MADPCGSEDDGAGPKRKRRSKQTDSTTKRKRQARGKTRILLLESYQDWKNIREMLKEKTKEVWTDCAVARLLIDSYNKHNNNEDKPRSPHSPPGPAKTPSPPHSPQSTPQTPTHQAMISSPQTVLQPPDLNAGHLSSVASDSEHDRTTSVLGEFRWLSETDEDDVDDSDMNALENSRISVEYYDEERGEWIDEDEMISDAGELREGEDEDWSEEDDDWEECDPEWVPPVRLRSSYRKLNEDMRTLPIITPEEEVFAHDQSVAEGTTEDFQFETPEQLQIKEPKDLVGMKCSIVYTECLLALVRFLRLPYNICKEKGCSSEVTPEPTTKSVGSGIILTWKCAEGHPQEKWCSQPRFKYSMQGGDFMLASNILLSGNNYSKVNLMFKFMNMGCVGPSTFYAIQKQYCVPAIQKYWEEENNNILRDLKRRDNVVLLGDGRMDSPGHCAQYCTYTTMDNDTKAIVSVEVVDKRETQRVSARTEKAAFQKMMGKMEAERVPVKEVCTDAHPQISVLMRPDTGEYGRKGIFHSLDVWHGAKNILKKIVAAGQEKGCTELKKWASHIVNHFWYCCQKSGRDFEVFLAMWAGVLNHVCNKHTWTLGGCYHDPISETEVRTTTWLVSGSAPHQKLAAIILNKRWLKTAHKFLRFRLTSHLESFQNHILMYASKRFAFSPDVYGARCLLAAIDYNRHKDRPVAKRKRDGEVMQHRSFQKKSDRWTYYNVKVPKDYSYIPELQSRIVAERIDSGRGMSRTQPMSENDPRRRGPLPKHPPPPTAQLVEQHRSRILQE